MNRTRVILEVLEVMKYVFINLYVLSLQRIGFRPKQSLPVPTSLLFKIHGYAAPCFTSP